MSEREGPRPDPNIEPTYEWTEKGGKPAPMSSSTRSRGWKITVNRTRLGWEADVTRGLIAYIPEIGSPPFRAFTRERAIRKAKRFCDREERRARRVADRVEFTYRPGAPEGPGGRLEK